MAALETYMDNIPIRRKFMQLYILCVLVPLIITDSVVFHIVGGLERAREYHKMVNIANSVSYNINRMVDNAGEIAKSIYTNKNANTFLEKEYDSSSEYYGAYQDFFQNTILENVLGMNQIIFTMYTDNNTVIRGGKIDNMTSLKKTKAYEIWLERGENEGLFFTYERRGYANSYQRKIVLLQNLDFFQSEHEQMLKIEFDYNNMMRMLRKMKFDNQVFVCEGDNILLSNGSFGGVGKDFEQMTVKQKQGYKQSVTIHGADLDIYVLKSDSSIGSAVMHFLPELAFLVLINVILPMGMVILLNRSFTKRISGLSKVFQSVNSEHLVMMVHENGKDEIGSMIRNYNCMVKRTNESRLFIRTS